MNNKCECESGFNMCSSTVEVNINGNSLINGTAAGSLVQEDGGITDGAGILLKDKDPTNPTKYNSKAIGISAVALNVRNNANGDGSIAGGYNSTTNTKADVAFNNSIAGLTADEFKNMYKKGYKFEDDGIIQIVDYTSQLSGSGVGGYTKRVVNGAFACNAGRAKGIYTFSCGLQTTSGAGSWAPYSATFGQSCRTVYTENEDGTIKESAACSLVGGVSSSIHAHASIGYGKNLTIPGRKVKLSDGTEFTLSTATFGSFNDFTSGNKNLAILEVGNGTSDKKDSNGNYLAHSNAFMVLFDGRAKVQSAPIDDDDIVRLNEVKNLLKLVKDLDDTKITALNKFAQSLSEEM